ncbi:MAG: CoA-acylating methylmalonate-semialdehyde dehydrogenase [Candidatus Lambdaproteobacteria bacterium]|nr:CoA-acylating methylmalonate-semialdehyde dehydrogenase [Candidatus Lambdaproteobacteria bacterium]
MEHVPLFINGRAEPAPAAVERLVLEEPASGEPYAEVPLCAADEVDRAAQAAQRAFPGWRDTPVIERARVLFRYRQMLESESEELARLISHDHGKTLPDARGEVLRGIEVVEFACGMPTLIQGATVQDVARGIDTRSIRQPLGVCAGITPFNFPVMVPMWMFPVAIAAGNTFVLKPSERVPRAAVRLAELAKEAGLPDGVLNVVHGGKAAVDALIDHPGVRAVSFVGSEPVARHVYRRAGEQGKRVQALSGAKNHLVVMPDCTWDKTIEGIMGAGYGSAGERCMAVSVVVAVGDAGDVLIGKLRDAAGKLKVGRGTDPGAEMGPLITRQHKERVLGHIARGVDEKATLALDGRAHPLTARPGNFVGPTLFDGVQPQMSIYQAEIFGPVLSVVRAATLEEAIALVNGNPYGNGTALFTNSGAAARKFENEVQVGMVGLNVPVPVPLAFFSFSGWKNSFFGDLHVHGRDGVQFYTETKTVTARWFGDGESAGARNMTIALR